VIALETGKGVGGIGAVVRPDNIRSAVSAPYLPMFGQIAGLIRHALAVVGLDRRGVGREVATLIRLQQIGTFAGKAAEGAFDRVGALLAQLHPIIGRMMTPLWSILNLAPGEVGLLSPADVFPDLTQLGLAEVLAQHPYGTRDIEGEGHGALAEAGSDRRGVGG